jgi:hypothetical protein
MSAESGGGAVAELAKWPELERLDNLLEPEAAPIAPVEIRFQVRPEPSEEWGSDLMADCSVEGRPAPSPGAVMTFREWEKDEIPTFYCYTLARHLRDGDKVKLQVRPRGTAAPEDAVTLWEKEFRVRVDGDKLRLE